MSDELENRIKELGVFLRLGLLSNSSIGLGLVALVAIFLPGLLAMVAALTFWSRIP